MTGLIKKKRKFSDAENKARARVLGGEPALRPEASPEASCVNGGKEELQFEKTSLRCTQGGHFHQKPLKA